MDQTDDRKQDASAELKEVEAYLKTQWAVVFVDISRGPTAGGQAFSAASAARATTHADIDRGNLMVAKAARALWPRHM